MTNPSGRGRLSGPASGHRDSSRAERGFAARFERTHEREPWIAASSAKRWLLREAPRSQREALAECVHGAKERSQREALAEFMHGANERSQGEALAEC